LGFLGAARTGHETFFERGGMPTHEVQPLDERAAAAVLEDAFPALAPRVRQRLVSEAQGNPLALLELPAALVRADSARLDRRSRPLPLTNRLHSVFASRIRDLPERTRQLLLLAALDGTGELRVLTSDPGQLADLTPAERARVVRVDSALDRLAFRHPLIRSAVVELSTSEERRNAHAMLAARRVEQPARHAWHLAEAATGPDERVAGLLHRVAHANLQRGDAGGAIADLLRAADMSPAGSDRSVRLSEAAYLGAIVLGDLHDVPGMLESVRRADPDRHGSLEGAVAGAYFLLNSDGDVDTAHRLLVGAIETLPDPTDAHYRALIEALYNLVEVCFFGGRAELWKPFRAALHSLKPRPPTLLAILADTFGDPARTALPALDRLDSAIDDLEHQTSAARIVRVGIAAAYLDRLTSCRAALMRVVRDGRDGGAVTSAIEALFLLANDAYFTGRWDEMTELLDEGLKLCETHDYQLLQWPARFLQGMLAAARGDHETAAGLAEDMTRWAAPRKVLSVAFYAAHVRALADLGAGAYDAAYHHAVSISAAGEFASHVPQALWTVLDVVESAVRSGRSTEARAHVHAFQELRIGEMSSRLALVTAGATAMSASPSDPDLFEIALQIPDATHWPFEHARIELIYGEHLRRGKATTQARQHLTTALATFQRLGCDTWAARAQSELRATGMTLSKADGVGVTSLTPQQQEIAELAASGLTNKQIGERLYLSPRTVATHLYQVFPKLGVTTRAALRDALAAAQA
jgi:DNA-binding CsgD family transcriptional regulator/tetratricopeptide (TPR) repeat protein